MRVFISHSSKDKAAVEALAQALRARGGIDPWFDKWEIGPGDDIVAAINAGLDEAGVGIIVFSRHTRESGWVEAEVSYLTYARIQEGKVLIPVTVGDDAWVPPLLRPLARRGIHEIDAIADAVLGRKPGPPPVSAPEHGRTRRVLISLRREGREGVAVEVSIDGLKHGEGRHESLPRPLREAQAEFLRGFSLGPHRDRADAERAAFESTMATLGRELRNLCLPGDSSKALAAFIEGAPLEARIEVCFEAEGAQLLGLPFEALRLPNDRLLATLPSVVVLRRPLGLDPGQGEPLAPPLKILVAVGAPDEGLNPDLAVLDQERELQNILDAVEPAARNENAEVRILEVGHPKLIGEAVEADAYHVLHLSCHGKPGSLVLEDEDGGAVPTTPDELLAPLKEAGRPLPLVLLSACHGGVVGDGQTASFAEALLRAGVPSVLAMQTAVSDDYATRLAGAFYRHLGRREHLLPSLALAAARRELENERLERIEMGAPPHEIPPEYAAATLFVAGEDRPLADFGLDKKPLTRRPVYEAGGPVPQLRIDDLIGRRQVLRETLRALRDSSRRDAGVVLTGIGGIGKSSVAGRAIQRLREDGCLVTAHVGRFDLASIAEELGIALGESPSEASRRLGERLLRPDLPDRVRLKLVDRALAEERIVLVLDDFEQNLTIGGDNFHDPDVLQALLHLAGNARKGRLLITSRHPIPGAMHLFQRIPIGPLSPAAVRKLVLRLPALRDFDPKRLAGILRVIGGHPRVLELLDGLLLGGKGRLTHVTRKLRALAAEQGLDLEGAADRIDEGLHAALLLGAHDVFLEELVAIVRGEGIADAMFQAATSNLPLTPDGLARMCAPDPRDGGDTRSAKDALVRLEALSLTHPMPNGAFVMHRWTADGLATIDGAAFAERCRRAGAYRMWRANYESRTLRDAKEAVRNFLAGEHFDEAVGAARVCFAALRRYQKSAGIAALASEVLETLPETHPGFALVADEEAQAHATLGASTSALRRYEQLLALHERLVQAEPERVDLQRDLSNAYSSLSDLLRDLGQGKQAYEFLTKSLAIAQSLVQAEPESAELQSDLATLYNQMGDLFRVMGQGEQALAYFSKSLAIRERLEQARPQHADLRRDLSILYDYLGDLFRDMGQGEQALKFFMKALAIQACLVRTEPQRADLQRDLSILCGSLGDLYLDLGRRDKARDFFTKALDIAEHLAQVEPERADFQRDLSVSYMRLGDLYLDLGRRDEARDFFTKALAITERLAQAEPERTDFQCDLSASCLKVGDLFLALGQREQARDLFMKSVAIDECLVQAEPQRADFQLDLSISLDKLAKVDNTGASAHLQRALEIVLALHDSGRLNPADEWMIPDLKRQLESLASTSKGD